MPFRRLILAAVLCFVLAPTAAHADSIDFGGLTGVPAGTWSWGGVGTSLTATGNFVLVSLVGVTPPPGITLTGATLTFTTAASTGGSGTTSDPWTFAANGPVVVTNTTGGDCTTGNCFLGTFTAAQLFFTGGGSTATFTGNFILGQVDPYIYSLLGIPINTPLGASGSLTASLVLASNSTLDSTGGSGTWGSGDLIVSPVPEPDSLALLGTGLTGIASLLRRRFKA